MKKVKVITSSQAAELVKDNDTITSIGFVSCAHPEALTKALEKRFLETGSPKNLTYMYAASQGKRDGRGGKAYIKTYSPVFKRVTYREHYSLPSLFFLRLNT